LAVAPSSENPSEGGIPVQIANLDTLRQGALALALLAGAALMPQAASAGSLQDRGDFGGTWAPIAPSDNQHWRYAERHYYRGPVYAAPHYAYGPSYYAPEFYGPPVYYDDAPGLVAPGLASRSVWISEGP
jgi:hypothetical protein